MKKTFLAMLLVGSSVAVFAQDDSMKTTATPVDTTNQQLSSSNSYNAYSTFNATLPSNMQAFVTRDYPTATDLHWQQNGDWWHGYYVNNGVPTHLYYNDRGQTFTVALPVHQTLVPDAVATKAVELYGPTLYDINRIKGSNGQDVYVVRILENGTLSSQYMAEDGSKVIDVYRVEAADPTLMNNMNMNNTQNVNTTNNATNETSTPATEVAPTDTKMKMKAKTSDGKKIKTKVVKSKTTTSEE